MTRALAPIALLDLALLAVAPTLPRVAMGAHLALTLAAVALWLRAREPGMAAAVAAPLGPFALLLAHVLARPPRGGDVLPELPSRAAPRVGNVGRLLDGRVRHVTPDSLGSLALVLRHGDIAARRSALEAVVRSFEPALSPLVAQALSDGDQTIRALAAAAAARIVQNLGLMRERLEAEGARAALVRLLGDHARDNVLLSDTQRAQLRADVLTLLEPGEGVHQRAEAAWAVGDYETLDAIVATAAEGAPPGVAHWWRATPA